MYSTRYNIAPSGLQPSGFSREFPCFLHGAVCSGSLSHSSLVIARFTSSPLFRMSCIGLWGWVNIRGGNACHCHGNRDTDAAARRSERATRKSLLPDPCGILMPTLKMATADRREYKCIFQTETEWRGHWTRETWVIWSLAIGYLTPPQKKTYLHGRSSLTCFAEL